jgi:hypothetical protein
MYRVHAGRPLALSQSPARLRRPKWPIAQMDTLIAAHAQSLGAVLVTNDAKHFSRRSPERPLWHLQLDTCMLGDRETMDRLHPATRAITDAPDPSLALALARALATEPPLDWNSREWLSVAAAANSNATADPLWLKVKVVACEHETTSTAPTDALRARAQLIAVLGRDDADAFCSLVTFLERAEDFVRADTPEAALISYRAARLTIFSAEPSSPDWLAARDTVVRCRSLREFAKTLLTVHQAGEPLPLHLQRWTSWADLKEEELSPVGS